jgi:hypothetical protein
LEDAPAAIIPFERPAPSTTEAPATPRAA